MGCESSPEKVKLNLETSTPIDCVYHLLRGTLSDFVLHLWLNLKFSVHWAIWLCEVGPVLHSPSNRKIPRNTKTKSQLPNHE
jgi:hypothetical protein